MDGDRAGHGIDDARELDQRSIAHQLHNAAMVFGNDGVNQVIPVGFECSYPNVRLWLDSDSRRPTPDRPLYPRQQTFQPPLPLSHRFRLLLGGKRTYGKGVFGVRS